MSTIIDTSICDVASQFPIPEHRSKVWTRPITGLRRRLARERRRRKVGRAYDMALEIARFFPKGSDVLDVGCGNGYIAHHLSSLLGGNILGIDVNKTTEAQINYRQYDGMNFPMRENSTDAVLLCYVLHHAADASKLLAEVKRVLRPGGAVVIYEDIPETGWDKAICWIHNRQWENRTGPCTFRNAIAWQSFFQSRGFKVMKDQRLSRARNLTHPVCRRLYLLIVSNELEIG